MTITEAIERWRGGSAVIKHASGLFKIHVSSTGSLHIPSQQMPPDAFCGDGWSLHYTKNYSTDDVIDALCELDSDIMNLKTPDWDYAEFNTASQIIHAVARALCHSIAGLNRID